MSISGNSFRYFDRTANVSFNEDVDLMIYHYLQYNAAKTALAALRMRLPQQARTASLILGSYDAFHRIFDQAHQSHQLSLEMRTMSRLTSLSVALAHRSGLFPNVAFDGGMPRRIKSGRERVQRMQDPKELATQMQSDRQACLKAMEMARCTRRPFARSPEHAQVRLASRPLLLDLLPDFLVFSARTAALLDQNVSEQWMQLAASFMFQAALEQYATTDSLSLDELDEAFAWGWRRKYPRSQEQHTREASDAQLSEESDLIETEDMFCTHGGDAQIGGWRATRCEYKAKFLRMRTKTWGEHIEELENEFPVTAFEETLLEYLNSLFTQIQKKPILIQLEEGQLEGMSKCQTANLLQRAFAN